MPGVERSEIVFNPSATVAGLSEYLWKLEQPAHAAANGYFIAAINRVGTEAPWNIGEFYGSSYFANPRGQIVAQASRDKDEVLTADLDLERDCRSAPNLAVFPRSQAGHVWSAGCILQNLAAQNPRQSMEGRQKIANQRIGKQGQ